MTFKNIHKWIVSLAFVVSLVSFSGVTIETHPKESVQTELIKTNKPTSKAFVYYYGALLELDRPTNFSFKTLLKSYNLFDYLQFQNLSNKALAYLANKHFEIFKHAVNQDDYQDFILV